MAIQHLFPIFLISLLCLSPIGYAMRVISFDELLSPFDFIKLLQGSVKGNRALGITGLKNYLQKFGYLENLNNTQVNNEFDDALESAIKTYQQNFNIKPTGILDAATVSTMIIPRCGVPDIINGANTMRSAGIENHKSSSSSNQHGHIHTVSHYSFFSGKPKWPPSKYNLTYGFLSNVPSNAVAPAERAFQNWDNATHFTFKRASSGQIADLMIGFLRGNHGDGASFDGPGGTLAHAFAPTNGRFHYDADERWSVDPVANTFHLETVALHEIGHLLGLGHSSVQAAIMFPSVSAGTAKIKLNADDIQGIKVLYNK